MTSHRRIDQEENTSAVELWMNQDDEKDAEKAIQLAILELEDPRYVNKAFDFLETILLDGRVENDRSLLVVETLIRLDWNNLPVKQFIIKLCENNDIYENIESIWKLVRQVVETKLSEIEKRYCLWFFDSNLEDLLFAAEAEYPAAASESIRYYEKIGDTSNCIKLRRKYAHIGSVFAARALSNDYIEKGEYEAALQLWRELLVNRKNYGDDEYTNVCWKDIEKIYARLDNKEEVEKAIANHIKATNIYISECYWRASGAALTNKNKLYWLKKAHATNLDSPKFKREIYRLERKLATLPKV